jgi:hypothetical protein
MAKERLSRSAVTSGSPETLFISKPVSSTKDAQKTGKKKPPGHSQITLWVSDELAYRLSEIARFSKMRKSSFAVKLLDQGCRQYKIDEEVKSAFLRICSQLREDAKDPAA